MWVMRNYATILAATGALMVTLGGCNSQQSEQAADAIENRADAVRDQADEQADATRNQGR